MKALYRIFLLLFSALAVSSCGDDFLDTEDKNNLSPDSYPVTMTHLNDMLNGVYGAQHSFGLFGHNMLGKNIYCWDHSTDLSWQGTEQWIKLAQNNTQINDEFLADTWRDAWKGVQRSNAFLAGIESYRQNYATPEQAEELNYMEGQAYFLRAWFYYYLIGFWGEDFIQDGEGGDKLGVPIVTKVPGNINEAKATRNTVDEVWAFMIEDLKKSEQLLKNKVWAGAEKHKATEWAAKAFIGKIYAMTDDWSNAKTVLEDVINNSNKQLVSFDVYKTMFNDKNEFNEESIFEINMNVDKNTWGAWGDQSTGSGVGMIISPCYRNDDGSSGASGWSNVFPHDKNLRRFGFAQPVPTDPSDNAYVATSKANRDNQTVDPRLYVALQQPYLDSMIADGKRRPIAHYVDVPMTFYGWSFRKYVNLEGKEYDLNVNNGSNFQWLRLADVYLLYAEALKETGNTSGALEYINKVKRRAYGLPVNSASAVDYASLSAATMANDPVLANDPLKYERFAELFGEGHWWFDVRRWKIGAEEAAYYERVRGGEIEWSDNDYAQPIPLVELISNSNMEQNQGYPTR